MRTRRIVLGAVMSAALLLVPGCGGGGGGGPPPLTVTGIAVQTQPQGPQSPFGSTLGGDTITINGVSFDTPLAGNNVTVQVGGAFAVVNIVTDTQITATTPPGPEGFADIVVTHQNGQTDTLSDSFQYIAPPAIQQITAQGGPTDGENRADVDGVTTMQITGTNLRAGMTLNVGGAVVPVNVTSPTTATFTAPASATESASNITVTNPEGQTATVLGGIVYTAEFSLTPASDAKTETDMRHVFRRAAFGASPARIAEAVADGLGTTLDKLMTFVNDDALENVANAPYAANVPPAGNMNNRVNKQFWLHLMLHNPNGFQERLAFFLHDHFAINEDGFHNDFRWTMRFMIQLLRRFSMAETDLTGDDEAGLDYNWFRMLVEIAKDRAILDWLDGRVSTRNNPNENFPRELWELFSLGEGNGYTEGDIQECSKALTGFNWFRPNPGAGDTPANFLQIRYLPGQHDTGQKTIFGVTGFFGYDSLFPFNGGSDTDPVDIDGGIVALTLQERGVQASQFIVGKLFAYFVYPNPDASTVEALAAQLRAPGPDQWNLKPIIRAMLESKAFFSARAIKSKVASPVEYLLGFMRDTEIELSGVQNTNTGRMINELAAMGQLVLAAPDVDGWFEDSLQWPAAQGQVERNNALVLAVQELDNLQTDISPLIPPQGQRSPAELVDHLANLLDVELTVVQRTELIAYVTTELDGNGQPQPFNYNQDNEDHVRMKVRGLIWMIHQLGQRH